MAEQKMKFKILALSVKENARQWTLKIKSPFGLTEALSNYKVKISVDLDYFNDQVKELEGKIKNVEAKPDMFDDYKASIRSLKDNIAQVKGELEEMKGLEIPYFNVSVEQVDFSKDTMTLDIPEDVVPEIIKIRHSVDAFVVNLK
ncbi:MAG: hypothetical protein EOL88_00625 [Bacteroidia bacterium]|nr:hypothetical protein [Bacteroidia bacterium]